MSESNETRASAARALRVSEAQFRGIVSIASDAIISVDEMQRIVLFNRGAEAIFGWTADQVLGQPLDILLPERFRAVHREHIRRFDASPVSARRMGERQEIAGLRRSGEEFPAEASISKLDIEGQRFFTVVLRDASERKRIERAQQFLAKAGERLAGSLDLPTTLSNVVALGVEFLADCCVIYYGGEAGGIRRVELAASDSSRNALLDELRATPFDRHALHPVVAVLETGVADLIPEVTSEYLRAHEGSLASMRLFRELGVKSAMVVPLVARDRTIGAIGFYSTKPERRYGPDDLRLAVELAARAALALDNARLYREARDAIRARDDVLAVVSHDLGNPLAAIRIGTGLLLRGVPEEERRSGGWQHLEGIRQSAEQMERLVNDLLEIKRIEAGLLPLETRRHLAGALIEETIELFQPIAEEKRIDLRAVVEARGPAVLCDRERALQVFSNLVGNALKFTPEGGTVEVSAQPNGSEVVFAVSDTGRGIAPEHLPHVFDRFWQAHRAKREGIGLGLAIVKGIVQAHGGRIWAESTPGTGSTFYFTLSADPTDSIASGS